MRTKYQRRKALLAQRAWREHARSVPYDHANAARKADAEYHQSFFDDFSPALRAALRHDSTPASDVAQLLMCGASEEEIIRRIRTAQGSSR